MSDVVIAAVLSSIVGGCFTLIGIWLAHTLEKRKGGKESVRPNSKNPDPVLVVDAHRSRKVDRQLPNTVSSSNAGATRALVIYFGGVVAFLPGLLFSGAGIAVAWFIVFSIVQTYGLYAFFTEVLAREKPPFGQVFALSCFAVLWNFPSFLLALIPTSLFYWRKRRWK